MLIYLFLLTLTSTYASGGCGDNILTLRDHNGMNALHEAVHPQTTPNILCVRETLERGADINLQTKKGSTALHLLFKGAYHDESVTESILDLFTEYDLDLSVKDNAGYEAIHYLYKNQKLTDEFKAKIVKKLISKGDVAKELPWIGIDVPILNHRLEIFPGPSVPPAVQAVFDDDHRKYVEAQKEHLVGENLKSMENLKGVQAELEVLREENLHIQQNLKDVQLENNLLHEENGNIKEDIKDVQASKVALLEGSLIATEEIKSLNHLIGLMKEETLDLRKLNSDSLLEHQATVDDLEAKTAEMSTMTATIEMLEARTDKLKEERTESQKLFNQTIKKNDLLVNKLTNEFELTQQLVQNCQAKMDEGKAKSCIGINITSTCSDETLATLEADLAEMVKKNRQITAFVVQIFVAAGVVTLFKKIFSKSSQVEGSPDLSILDNSADLAKYIAELDKVATIQRGLTKKLRRELDVKDKTINDLQEELSYSQIEKSSLEENETNTSSQFEKPF